MSREIQTVEVLSDQYLLSKNQIYLFGPVNTAMAARAIPQMHYIEQKMIDENLPEEERVLTLLINSPGGSVTDGSSQSLLYQPICLNPALPFH